MHLTSSDSTLRFFPIVGTSLIAITIIRLVPMGCSFLTNSAARVDPSLKNCKTRLTFRQAWGSHNRRAPNAPGLSDLLVTTCSVELIDPFSSLRDPEGKSMLLIHVDPRKALTLKTYLCKWRAGKNWRKRQATPFWQLTEFLKGKLHRRHFLGSCKMKWTVSTLLTGARKLSYGVKMGE